MNLLKISSRKFRDNQKTFLDIVDSGKNIVIRRSNKSYLVSALKDEEFKLSPEAEQRVEESREQYKKGQFITCDTAEDAINFLKSL